MTTLATRPSRAADLARRGSSPMAFAAALSLSAAIAHLDGVTVHGRQWWAYGAFFLVTGVLQATLAALLLWRPRAWMAVIAIPGNLAIVGMYVYTRTNGPPLGPHRGAPESPELLGMATCAAELAVAIILLRLLGERTGRAMLWGMLVLGLAGWALRVQGTLL
jgi:hypothetical protein